MGKEPTIKSLADRLRSAMDDPQQANAKPPKQTPAIGDGPLLAALRALDYAGQPVELTTFRCPRPLYRRLKVLAHDNISIQRLTVFAVMQLLETDEIKSRIQHILNELNQ